MAYPHKQPLSLLFSLSLPLPPSLSLSPSLFGILFSEVLAALEVSNAFE